MNEMTRIATVEFTFIAKNESFREKDEYSAAIERMLKRDTRADDVKVIKVQDFLLEKEE